MGWFRRLSIEQKLPLLVGAILAVVIVALSAAAVIEARRSALLVATGRMARVSRQLSQTTERATQAIRAQADSLAADPALREFLRERTRRTTNAALAALAFRGANPGVVAAVELVDAAGRPLLAMGTDTARVRAMPDRRGALAVRNDSTLVSPFVPVGDSAAYAVVAPVPGTRGRTAVVVWRYLVSSESGRVQTAELLGSQATLYFGNAQGGVWSDLARLVPPPPVDPAAAATPVQYHRGKDLKLALATPVPGTPWLMLLEFSHGAVVGPIRSFMLRLGGIAILLLAVGLFGGWVASRRITGPLRELTLASEALSAADYSARVSAEREDELGRLARVFNRAAERVRDSQAVLEHKVAERTRALERAQDELVRREKLAILGLLASGLSHELRNPLGVMTNAVYYLDGVLIDPPGQVKRYLRILQEQIARSERIVGDLIDFVGVEPPQKEPVSLAALVERQFGGLAVPDRIEVERCFPPQLPTAFVDPAQLGQVVFNLMINALQAMGGGPGVLTLRGVVHDRDHVRLEIQDTGPGIPADQLERIFEPLFSTKAQGIGLGLAVCRTLAAANGASITVSSEEGRGAIFMVVLPGDKEAVAA
jgi:signal transduction histidine kinase